VISSLEVGGTFRVIDAASGPLKEIAAQLKAIQAAMDKVKGSLVELAESKFPGLTRRIGTLAERMDALAGSAQKGADSIDRAFSSTDAAIGTTIGRVQQLKAELASLNAPALLGGGGGGGGGRRWGGAARGHGGGGFSAHESLGPVSFRGHGDGTVAGAVGAFSVWEALKANADLQQVQANLAASGVSPGEISRATSFAYGFSDYGLSAREVLQSINEIRNPLNKGATADSGVEDAMRHMPTLSAAANVLRAQGGRNGGNTAIELYGLVKSAEFRNAISDNDFDKAINSMVKADVATGGIVTPRTFLQMSQMLKGALPGLSDQYLYTIMPELAQEFRGQQAGTAAASLYQQLVAGQMRTKGVNLLSSLGLVDRTKVEYDTTGRIKAANPGFFTDETVFKANPKQGIADIITAMTLGYQYQRLQRGAQGIDNTLDIGPVSKNLMDNNPFTQWSQFTSSLTNFLALSGGELMPSATSALKNLTATLQALIDLFSGKGASWSLLTGSGASAGGWFGSAQGWLADHGLHLGSLLGLGGGGGSSGGGGASGPLTYTGARTSLADAVANLSGRGENDPLVHKWIEETGGHVSFNEWCADFVNATLAHQGIRGTGSSAAASFLGFGTHESLADARPGDIMVARDGLKWTRAAGPPDLGS
jgi:hypothetical protein